MEAAPLSASFRQKLATGLRKLGLTPKKAGAPALLAAFRKAERIHGTLVVPPQGSTRPRQTRLPLSPEQGQSRTAQRMRRLLHRSAQTKMFRPCSTAARCSPSLLPTRLVRKLLSLIYLGPVTTPLCSTGTPLARAHASTCRSHLADRVPSWRRHCARRQLERSGARDEGRLETSGRALALPDKLCCMQCRFRIPKALRLPSAMAALLLHAAPWRAGLPARGLRGPAHQQ
jgi:hypothetical protein